MSLTLVVQGTSVHNKTPCESEDFYVVSKKMREIMYSGDLRRIWVFFARGSGPPTFIFIFSLSLHEVVLYR